MGKRVPEPVPLVVDSKKELEAAFYRNVGEIIQAWYCLPQNERAAFKRALEVRALLWRCTPAGEHPGMVEVRLVDVG